MSIVIKNAQLNNETIEALNSLIEMDINASSAFKLTRIIKEISSIVEDKLKMEKRILDKWVQKNEDGSTTIVTDESGNQVDGAVNILNPEEFTKEMSTLMDLENSIPYEKLKFEDMNLSTAKVKDLIKLEFLFD